MSIARPTNGQPHGRDTLTHGEPPPGLPEAEAQLIGAALLLPANIPLIDAVVGHRDLTDARCRTAWSHLRAMHAAGERIDAVSLLLHCRAAGDEEAVGGSVQLMRWMDDCICPSDPRDKAAIVAERGAKREAFFALVEGARACQNGQALGEILGDVRGRLDAIGSASGAAGDAVYTRITAAEMASTQYDIRFHIAGMLPVGQPAGIFGAKKSLKTSLMCDMAISVASGRPFLGYFRVETTARVAVFSAESGMATLQDTLLRQCRAANLRLDDLPIVFCDTVPQFGSVRHLDALEKFLVADDIGLVFVDPAYLAMLTAGNEGSIFAMGGLLRGFSETCQRIGCTPVLLHHMRKSVADPFAPGDLDDASWAGFAEFCRSWLLINRRAKYEAGTGMHRLWLTSGGSIGHSGLWGLDIDEGPYSGPGTRVWDVTVMRPDDVAAANLDGREAAADAKKREQIDRNKKHIVATIGKMPGRRGTKSQIKEWAARNTSQFGPAWAELLSDGSLVPCDIERNKRIEAGYMLSDGPE